MSKLAVVAIGGNALIEDEGDRDGPGQLEAICASAKYSVDLIVNGWSVVITHDNAPQSEQADGQLPERKLLMSRCLPASRAAELQGRVGHLIQTSLDAELQQRGLNRRSVCLLTRVVVSPAGAEVRREAEAQASASASQGLEARDGPQAEPRELVEQEAIKALLQAGFIVIAAAGGSTPVVRDGEGRLQAVEVRLQSELAASFLATQLNADLFLIATATEKVPLFPQQAGGNQVPDMLTLAELRQHEAAGYFASQRLHTKIRAVIRYLERGGGAALLTCPQAIGRALAGRTGTWILP
ncbi:hypothetical protein [Thermogemmatispora sp.]|uniref:amino acid kinase family protein n=1 Tax=Thermogemmatispora sp. TaxID=1968838 RepID=UPI0035E42111